MTPSIMSSLHWSTDNCTRQSILPTQVDPTSCHKSGVFECNDTFVSSTTTLPADHAEVNQTPHFFQGNILPQPEL